MDPRFELWDTVSGNLIGYYDSIPDALKTLAQGYEDEVDREEILDFALVLRTSGSEPPLEVLDGASLLAMSSRKLTQHANTEATGAVTWRHGDTPQQTKNFELSQRLAGHAQPAPELEWHTDRTIGTQSLQYSPRRESNCLVAAA